MLNSLSELSKQTFDGDMQDGVASTNVEVLEPVLNEEEAIRYVMVSTKGIEHTTESRTTTVTPDSDHSTYAVVTGHRVLFLVGTASDEVSVDIEFDMGAITMAKARSSLLSNSLVVTANQTNSVKFVPTSEAEPEAVADYIDRISNAWQDLTRSLAGARESIDEFEAALAEGGDTHEHVQKAQSRLSSAIHAATRNDDGPSEDMMARIEEVEEELDTLRVRTRLERVDTLVEDAEASVDAGEHDAAIESIVEADERLLDAKRDLEDAADSDTALGELDDATADVDRVASMAIEAALARCDEAAATADPQAAVEAWSEAREWFLTAQDADWDGTAGVSADAWPSRRPTSLAGGSTHCVVPPSPRRRLPTTWARPTTTPPITTRRPSTTSRTHRRPRKTTPTPGRRRSTMPSNASRTSATSASGSGARPDGHRRFVPSDGFLSSLTGTPSVNDRTTAPVYRLVLH